MVQSFLKGFKKNAKNFQVGKAMPSLPVDLKCLLCLLFSMEWLSDPLEVGTTIYDMQDKVASKTVLLWTYVPMEHII